VDHNCEGLDPEWGPAQALQAAHGGQPGGARAAEEPRRQDAPSAEGGGPSDAAASAAGGTTRSMAAASRKPARRPRVSFREDGLERRSSSASSGDGIVLER